MAKSKILQEAMADAKQLKEAAIQNAQNILAESMKNNIKEFMDSQLGEVDVALEAGGESNDEEEEIEVPDLEQEAMYNMPVEAEDKSNEFEEEDEEEMDEMRLGLGEAEDKEDNKEDKENEEEIDEEVELTAEELKTALSEVLRDSIKEATVTKSFGDVQDATPKSAGGKQQTGIADEKSGEHQWSEEDPSDTQDWTVKEGKMKKVIRGLSRELGEYKEACAYLKKQLKEVALFNNKLLHTNKVLQSTNLTDKQRLTVVEMFDRAKSINEVELVYKTLSEGFKIAGVVSESKKKGLRAKSSSFTTTSSTLLNESRNQNVEQSWSERQKILAGIVK